MPPVGATAAQQLRRLEVRSRLIERLRARITDPEIGVVYQLPPNYGLRRVVTVNRISGNVSPRGMAGRGRTPRTDRFSIQVVCGVGPNAVEVDLNDPLDPGGFRSLDAAVLELVGHLDAELAEDPALGFTDGGTVVATLGELDGPNAQQYTDGVGSVAVVQVEVETHLN